MVEWKSIEFFEGKYKGLYEVSALGEVRQVGAIGESGAIIHIGPFVVEPVTNQNSPYLLVPLLDKYGSRQQVRIHVLVYSAFSDIPWNGKTRIRHIDGNRHNNRIENLSHLLASSPTPAKAQQETTYTLAGILDFSRRLDPPDLDKLIEELSGIQDSRKIFSDPIDPFNAPPAASPKLSPVAQEADW